MFKWLNGKDKARISELERQVEELTDSVHGLSTIAETWDNTLTAHLYDSKRAVQDAIVRAFSSKLMMDWLANAKQTAEAPDLSSLVQLAYPALRAMKPGPLNNG